MAMDQQDMNISESSDTVPVTLKKISILWRNQYITINFDFDETVNELHYYLSDYYQYPIIGDFFHRLEYLYPMYSLSSQGIAANSLIILSTACYERYQVKQWGYIYQSKLDTTSLSFPYAAQSEAYLDVCGIEELTETMKEMKSEEESLTCRKKRKDLKSVKSHTPSRKNNPLAVDTNVCLHCSFSISPDSDDDLTTQSDNVMDSCDINSENNLNIHQTVPSLLLSLKM